MAGETLLRREASPTLFSLASIVLKRKRGSCCFGGFGFGAALVVFGFWALTLTFDLLINFVCRLCFPFLGADIQPSVLFLVPFICSTCTKR
jgi:hypothetical protein